jgi:hypothetical protein
MERICNGMDLVALGIRAVGARVRSCRDCPPRLRRASPMGTALSGERSMFWGEASKWHTELLRHSFRT